MARFRLARSLKLFWGTIAVLAGLGVIWLAALGPVTQSRHGAGAVLSRPRNGIPAPNPALLVPSPVRSSWQIPHPGPGGTLPMQYYAAIDRQPDARHKVAVMIGGLGSSLNVSMAAVKQLPPAVSLALSPYGAHISKVAAAARKAGHETLMGLAMQTEREPAVTEGDEALHDGALASENLKRLDWMLSRVPGYAGVADEIGMSVQETFLSHDLSQRWLGRHLRADGLFLVAVSDTAAVPAGMQGRKADVVIRADMTAEEQQNALKQLAAIAASKGSALGVVTSPTANDVTALAQWCRGLAADGVTLVPVSALAAPAATQ